MRNFPRKKRVREISRYFRRKLQLSKYSCELLSTFSRKKCREFPAVQQEAAVLRTFYFYQAPTDVLFVVWGQSVASLLTSDTTRPTWVCKASFFRSVSPSFLSFTCLSSFLLFAFFFYYFIYVFFSFIIKTAMVLRRSTGQIHWQKKE